MYGVHPPPPPGTNPPPVSSPMAPVPPPSKKQRAVTDRYPGIATATDDLTAAVDESIAARKAELRRLQRAQQQSGVVAAGAPAASTEDLLAKARSHLNGTAGGLRPPPPTSFRGANGGTSTFPTASKRTSELFAGGRTTNNRIPTPGHAIPRAARPPPAAGADAEKKDNGAAAAAAGPPHMSSYYSCANGSSRPGPPGRSAAYKGAGATSRLQPPTSRDNLTALGAGKLDGKSTSQILNGSKGRRAPGPAPITSPGTQSSDEDMLVSPRDTKGPPSSARVARRLDQAFGINSPLIGAKVPPTNATVTQHVLGAGRSVPTTRPAVPKLDVTSAIRKQQEQEVAETAAAAAIGKARSTIKSVAEEALPPNLVPETATSTTAKAKETTSRMALPPASQPTSGQVTPQISNIASPPDTVLRNAERALAARKTPSASGGIEPTTSAKKSSGKREVLNSLRMSADTPDRRETLSAMRMSADTPPVKDLGKGSVDEASAHGRAPVSTSVESTSGMRNAETFDTRTEEKKDSTLGAYSQSLDAVSRGRKAAIKPTGKDDVSVLTMSSAAPRGGGSKEGSSVLRLMRELKQSQDEKTAALEQASKLEAEIQSLRLRNADFGPVDEKGGVGDNARKNDLVAELLRIKDSQGEEVALQWASDQLCKMRGNGEATGTTPGRTPRSGRSAFLDAHDSGVNPPPGLSVLSPVGIMTPRGPGSQGASPESRMAGSVSFGVGDDGLPPRGRRVATPHPKRRVVPGEKGENAGVDCRYLAAAATSIPDEYTSNIATYYIRRPYSKTGGSASALPFFDDETTWESNGLLSPADYMATADVAHPDTIEIMANISADGSILVLHNISTVRHLPAAGLGAASVHSGSSAPDEEVDWVVYDDAEGVDRPLGCVMYIDRQGNEGEYWLDTVYEEALAAREAYCSSLLCAASALQSTRSNFLNEVKGGARGIPASNIAAVKQQTNGGDDTSARQARGALPLSGTPPVPKRHVDAVDACVGTEDVPFPAKDTGKTSKEPRKGDEKLSSRKSQHSQNVQPDDGSDANDVLSTLLGFFFWTTFSAAWFLFVRLPLKVVSGTVIVFMVCALLGMIWLELADDNGAWDMGAGIDYGYNRPGVF